MALVQEKLYKAADLASIDLGEYVRDISKELAKFYQRGSQDIQLHVEANDIRLRIDLAIPCGLILSELISNAFKHAFAPNGAGHISIIIRKMENQHLEIVVSDNGSGLPMEIDPFTTQSAGLYVVNGLVKNQLHGELTVHRGKGTEFRITVPV